MGRLNESKLFDLVNSLSVQFFQKPFRHEVSFNYRLRTTGGRYIPAKRKIELNPKYVIEMGRDEFIGIIKHELCHYHLHIEGKGYKHGDPSFKQLLKATGSPRHCKPLPSTKNKYRYLYVCNQCHHIYRRIRKVNVNKFKCGKCSGNITLKNNRN